MRALAGMLGVVESDSVLDLGTGTAALLAELARSAHPPRRAVGVDSSPRMLARAPELPPDWRLIKADAGALPFPDESFSVVTASYLLHFLSREARAKVIAEAERVLAPGGRVGVVTVAPPSGPIASLASWPIRAAAKRSNGAAASLRTLDPRDELEAAGLDAMRWRRTRAGYPSLCVVAERRH